MLHCTLISTMRGCKEWPQNLSPPTAFGSTSAGSSTRHGATITGMAEKLGMSRPALSRVLHGHEDISLDRAERIAGFFGLELHIFWRR